MREWKNNKKLQRTATKYPSRRERERRQRNRKERKEEGRKGACVAKMYHRSRILQREVGVAQLTIVREESNTKEPIE